MRIYYLTRTYDFQSCAGCAGLRNCYVELLRKKYEVVVVSPNYNSKEIIVNEKEIRLPFKPNRCHYYFELIGIYEDYLDPWVKSVIPYLESRIKKDDLLFSTTGGELGCVKLGSILKKKIGCKFIVNFHDPVDYTHVGRFKTRGNLHVSRDKLLKKYIRNTDGVITWGRDYANILKEQYPFIQNAIGLYRGYRYCNIFEKYIAHKEFKIIYAGAMGPAQGIDKMLNIWGGIDGVFIEIIGNPSKKVLNRAKHYSNVKLLGLMTHEECMNYMKKEADVCVVSLIPRELGIGTPSKIYDIINLEKPILGIMPKGEGQNFINNGFGLAADYKDVIKCRENLKQMMNKNFYEKTVNFIKEEKPKWSMTSRFEDVYKYIGSVMK